MMRRALSFLVAAFCALALAAWTWLWTFEAAVEAAAAKGRSDLGLAADRLTLELQRSRDLAVFLGLDPRIRAWLSGEGDLDAADAVLQGFADRSGATDITLLQLDGTVAAASDEPVVQAASRAFFERARHGALGVEYEVWRGRVIHAAPVFGPSGVEGIVAVSRALNSIESGWRGEPRAIYFTDQYGRVVVTNREELRQQPPQRSTPFRGYDIRAIEAGAYLPSDALHLEMSLPVLNLTGELLLDLTPARELATARALATGAVLLVLGGLIVGLVARRRTLALANATLEARVARRTRALQAANARLQAEVHERRETEAALTRAQAELVQAGKLSALGQMSAGISHELNQPLMAIRSYARNAREFLSRDNGTAAGENLGKIADLADRMGRIIRNLSAFARAEPEPAAAVDLREVARTAVEITEARRNGIETRISVPVVPVMALGDEVQLGQVAVNLIANAADAMEPTAKARITVRVMDDPPRLIVTDTGTGLRDPAKVFDPFYTTKEPGSGLGLGLSISYGIVAGFGGAIRGRNVPEGAEFTVTLRPASAEAAA
ncbi:MAG: ATP-binding protein [Pseudomonadota bacterium]